MRTVIASMGVPFDHDHFAAFIWELYAKDTYRSLRAPAIFVAPQLIFRHSEPMTILSLIMSLTFEIICWRHSWISIAAKGQQSVRLVRMKHVIAWLLHTRFTQKTLVVSLSTKNSLRAQLKSKTHDSLQLQCPLVCMLGQARQFLNSSYSDVTLAYGGHEFPSHRTRPFYTILQNISLVFAKIISR